MMSIAIAIKNMSFRFVSSFESSLSGGGCVVPIRNMTMIAKKTHPVKTMTKIAIHAAYFCFSPKTARKIWPPSSCPAGNKFIDVINKPIHPAKAIGLRFRANPGSTEVNIFVNPMKSNELPSTVSPWTMLETGTISDVISPTMVTGMAMINPTIGPAIPTSNNAFLFGMGSLLEINAPNVPMLNPGIIGGIGMKKGKDVIILCFFEM